MGLEYRLMIILILIPCILFSVFLVWCFCEPACNLIAGAIMLLFFLLYKAAEFLIGLVSSRLRGTEPPQRPSLRSLSRRVRQTEYERDGRFAWHWRSLIVSAAPITMLVFAILAHNGRVSPLRNTPEFLCQSPTVYWIFFGLSYTLYLLEALLIPLCMVHDRGSGMCASQSFRGCWSRTFSSSLVYLWRIQTVNDSRAYQQRVQEAAPRVEMRIITWHMETETRTTGGHGRGEKQTYTRTKRVVTNDVRRDKGFRSWADMSGEWPDVQSRPQALLKVKQTFEVEALDEATREHLEREAEAFRREYRDRDQQMEYSEQPIVDGYEEKVLIVDKAVGRLLRPLTYVALALLMLSWPYHLYLEAISFRATWHIKKVLSVGSIQQVRSV